MSALLLLRFLTPASIPPPNGGQAKRQKAVCLSAVFKAVPQNSDGAALSDYPSV